MLEARPLIYERFCRATGVPGHEILFFDDLQGNVEGAIAAGWRAVRIDPLADPAAQMHRALADLGVTP